MRFGCPGCDRVSSKLGGAVDPGAAYRAGFLHSKLALYTGRIRGAQLLRRHRLRIREFEGTGEARRSAGKPISLTFRPVVCLDQVR